MSDADRQLVEAITEQVIKLLRESGSLVTPRTSFAPTGPVPHTAHVQPPIGQCTGDYSKFPELAGKLYGSASPASLAVATAARSAGKMQATGGDGGGAAGDPWPTAITSSPMVSPRTVGVSASGSPASATTSTSRPGDSADLITGLGPRPLSPASTPLPLTGIVTANQLQQAMNAASDGVVWLANDAKLTPLANDLARSKKDNVKRGAPPQRDIHADPSKPTHSVGGSAVAGWLWWIDGGCPVVRDVTQSFGLALRPIAAAPTGGSLSQVVRELARAVKSKQTPGGILFVPTASRAICLANRCPSLRAIVGTSGEAIEQGIRDLGANVLIIEYPHHGHRSVAAMLTRFTQQSPNVPPSVERDLVDMQRCV